MRILTAKYERANFLERIGPSGRPYRHVEITLNDVRDSREEIAYDIVHMSRNADFGQGKRS